MKNNIFRLVLTAALGLAGYNGYEFAIENYTDTNIVLEDGTTFESKDIVKHKTSVFPSRKLENVKGIAWHHAAWETQDIQKIADWHVNGNNWPGIGYHGAIKKDGTYLVLNDLETLSYHARGSNRVLVGICFMGDASDEPLTDNQIKTAKIMLEAFCMEMDIQQSIGHRDTKGASTECPGDAGYEQLQNAGMFFNAN